MLRLARQKRILSLLCIFALCFVFLVGKLFKIQVMDGRRYVVNSVQQRSQEYILDSGRGDILDREGRSLAGSYTRKVLIAFPSLIEDVGQLAASLASLPGEKKDLAYLERLFRGENTGPPRAVALDLDPGEAARFRESKVPGLVVAREKVRYGPDSLAPHLAGYLGNLDREQLEEKLALGYSLTDRAGKSGLEEMFERELRGNSPESISVFLDAYRRLVPGLGYRYREPYPHPGAGPMNLHLTLDSHIQKVVETVMERYVTRGAVVVMDPYTGDILAMASLPYLDQQDPGDRDNDFLNRALQNYPPGSIFKIVTATAALDSRAYRPGDLFTCQGEIQLGKDIKKCFQGIGHGEISFLEAMAYSCNTSFIEVGITLGSREVIGYAEKLGLGERTGLFPPGLRHRETNAGHIPSRQEIPYPGHLANTVLGQGQVLVTPLQVARLLSAVANGGRLVRPRLVTGLTNTRGLVVEEYPVEGASRVMLPSTAASLQQMLVGVTIFGTGQEAAVNWGVTVGKTGTAQWKTRLDGREQALSWFAGYTLAEKPPAVTVVLVEEGKEGYRASRVYGEIMERLGPYL